MSALYHTFRKLSTSICRAARIAAFPSCFALEDMHPLEAGDWGYHAVVSAEQDTNPQQEGGLY